MLIVCGIFSGHIRGSWAEDLYYVPPASNGFGSTTCYFCIHIEALTAYENMKGLIPSLYLS